MRVLTGVLLAVGAATAASEDLPVFEVHFVVLTGNSGAQRVATPGQLRREVDILNAFFVNAAREPLVRFRFKGATLFPESRSYPTYGDQHHGEC